MTRPFIILAQAFLLLFMIYKKKIEEMSFISYLTSASIMLFVFTILYDTITT